MIYQSRKSIFTALLFASFFVNGQSNKLGTIHASFVLGGIIGGSSPSFTNNTNPKTTANADGLGLGGTIGVRASIGVSNKVSIGLFFRNEGTTSINTTEDKKHTYDVSTGGWGFGPEVKIYLTNTDNLNVYFAPSIGYSITTDKIKLDNKYNFNGTSSGISYGATLGVNKYFNNYIGFSVDFGLQGFAIGGKSEVSNNLTYFNSFVGVVLSGGLVFKIGGNK